MIDVIKPLQDVFEKSTNDEFRLFLNQYPKEVSWYLISDYCIGDRQKENDVISFSLLLNHDTIDNIKNYIKKASPKDLKRSRKVSAGLISYLNSPVVFHFTLVIPRKENFLRELVPMDYMRQYILEIQEIMLRNIKVDKIRKEYYSDILKRINEFLQEFKKKNFSQKLFRQILVTCTFGALILNLLKLNSNPSEIAWISDRDAIIDKHGGIAFDLLFWTYKVISSGKEYSKVDPKMIYVIPEKSGVNYYDELIRIPDHLAGTLASIKIGAKNELHVKHETILRETIVNTKNHVTLLMECIDDLVFAKKMKWFL